MTVSALGPHCADSYTANSVAMINQFVDEFNAGMVNIMRAQNPDQAYWLAKDIAQRRPQTAVFLRDRWGPLGNGDEGLLKTFPDPYAYCLWMYGQYGPNSSLIHVVGNEITLSSYNHKPTEPDLAAMKMSYTEWMIRAMREFHERRMVGAWLRFSVYAPAIATQIGSTSVWFETIYDGKRGFFRADFCKLVPSPLPPTDPNAKIYSQNDVDALKVKYDDMMRHVADVAETGVLSAKHAVMEAMTTAVEEAFAKIALIPEDISDANNQ